MVKKSKRYQQALAMVPTSALSLVDAVKALQGLPKAKFDETVEMSFRLNVDPKQSTQMVRGTVRLPHGSGKTVRVIVFTENPEEALKAGADKAGFEDLIKEVSEGFLDFDVAISTTSAMKEVRKVARVLGPKGLMPNPKSGTVTTDVTKAINDIKAGKVEYRLDKTAVIHCSIGKKSFGKEKLQENYEALMDAIIKAKPAAAKGQYVKSVTIASTMGPGVKINAKN